MLSVYFECATERRTQDITKILYFELHTSYTLTFNNKKTITVFNVKDVRSKNNLKALKRFTSLVRQDRQTDRQTLGRRFTLSTTEAASIITNQRSAKADDGIVVSGPISSTQQITSILYNEF